MSAAGSGGLTHLGARGEASMVDVSGKPPCRRSATASGIFRLAPATLDRIEAGSMAKGDVWAAARLAGIMAAKRTGELLPLAHTLPLSHAEVSFRILPSRDAIEITASAAVVSSTGVEMEALAAVSVAALTLYDMCKAVDKSLSIGSIRLVRKEKRPLEAPR